MPEIYSVKSKSQKLIYVSIYVMQCCAKHFHNQKKKRLFGFWHWHILLFIKIIRKQWIIWAQIPYSAKGTAWSNNANWTCLGSLMTFKVSLKFRVKSWSLTIHIACTNIIPSTVMRVELELNCAYMLWQVWRSCWRSVMTTNSPVSTWHHSAFITAYFSDNV